ncbi:hypothetical protein M4D55_18630 [Metabacillus idriensis]|uniref:hypothetical protein n=1 Tax=Metabacillus idriensis TaxID=324768 RepID=UPI00203CE10C|nr:hypothetical protein [Metabacillus idriensis]MCM3597789.1 hypothetical protein [Metabacillus idriensis]
MDDQIFEQRLSNLKQSYQQLPVQTSAGEIMERIKKEQKKKRSFFSAQTLYAASFIGVLIIAGLLGTQLLMQKEHRNGGAGDQPPAAAVPPSAEEIEARHEEIRQLYDEHLTAFDEEVSIADPEQYAFIQDAKKAVADFEKRDTFKSKPELENYCNKVKQTVRQNVAVPSEQLRNLRTKAEEGQQIKDEEIISLLEKQRIMNEYYFEKWLAVSQNLQYTDVFAFADELNSSGTDDPEAGPVVKEIRDSGYRFYHEGEGMINFQSDLTLLEAELKPSPQMQKYFEMENQAQVTEDGAVSVTPQELADRTVALEDFINKNPNFKYGEMLRERYEFWLFLLLKGLNNSPAIDEENRLKEEWKSAMEYVMEKDPNSQTAAAVSEFYNYLKEKNFTFNSIEEYQQYKVTVPESLRPAVSFYGGREFNLLPLSNRIYNAYLSFKDDGNETALNELQPADMLRLYMYTIVKGDTDTAYELLFKEEGTPSKEEFEREIQNKAPEYQALSNKLYKLGEKYDENNVKLEFFYEDGSVDSFELRIDPQNYSSKIVYPKRK